MNLIRELSSRISHSMEDSQGSAWTFGPRRVVQSFTIFRMDKNFRGISCKKLCLKSVDRFLTIHNHGENGLSRTVSLTFDSANHTRFFHNLNRNVMNVWYVNPHAAIISVIFYMQEKSLGANALDDERYRWPNGVVPYKISDKFSECTHNKGQLQISQMPKICDPVMWNYKSVRLVFS